MKNYLTIILLLIIAEKVSCMSNDTIPSFITMYKIIKNCDYEANKKLIDLISENSDKVSHSYKHSMLRAISLCRPEDDYGDFSKSLWDTIEYGKDFIFFDLYLRTGMDINSLNYKGETVLFRMEHPREVYFFTEKGGDLNQMNNEGQTVLNLLFDDIFVFFFNALPSNYMRSLCSITYLLEHGATSKELNIENVNSIEERKKVLWEYLLYRAREKGEEFEELETYLLENGLPEVKPVLVDFPDDWK